MVSIMDSYQDETIQCIDCLQTFTYSAQQQQIHHEKGYRNKPKRCPKCRRSRHPKSEMTQDEVIRELCKAVGELRVKVDTDLARITDELHGARQDITKTNELIRKAWDDYQEGQDGQDQKSAEGKENDQEDHESQKGSAQG